MPFDIDHHYSYNGMGGDVVSICDLSASACVSLAYDAKFNLVVEAAGEEGLRFRQFAPETAANNQSSEEQASKAHTNQSHWILSDVMRYLNVPTSHVVFTPYNIMLCCHGKRMSMVRHCTGRLVYETVLDCGEISGAVFDNSTDSFYVSHASTGAVTCMHYMEFQNSRKLELKFSVVPSALCIFANTILIPNKSNIESYCGLCYKMDDHSVYKINRVPMSRTLTGRQQKLAEATTKQARPSTLNGVIVLTQPGSQNSKATMIGISGEDHCMYMYKIRARRAKEGTNHMSLAFRFKSRDDATYSDRNGNLKLPRSIVAISNEFFAVFYETSTKDGKLLGSYGILLFRIRQSSI